jgi:Ca2+/Na+ antiporter
MLHPTKYDDGNIEDVTNFQAFFHFVTIGWKFIGATIPPSHKYNGKLAFIIALSYIGLTVLVMIQVVMLFSCVTGIGRAVLGVTVIPVGFSISDLYISNKSIRNEKYGDSAIMHVVCGISMNVFLGFGFSWMMGSVRALQKLTIFTINTDVIEAEAVLTFVSLAIGFGILVLRRKMRRGEFGGPMIAKCIASASLVVVYLAFVGVSIVKL